MQKLGLSLSWLLMSLMLLASSFSAYHSTQHVFDTHSHEAPHSFLSSQVYQLSHGLNEHSEKSYEPCDKCLLLSNLHGVDTLTLNLGLSGQLPTMATLRQTDLPNRTRAAYSSRAPPITA